MYRDSLLKNHVDNHTGGGFSQHPGCFSRAREPQLGRTQRRLWDYFGGEFSDQRWSRSSKRAAPNIQLLWISVFKVLTVFQDVYQTFVFFAAYYCDEINLVLFRVFLVFLYGLCRGKSSLSHHVGHLTQINVYRSDNQCLEDAYVLQ